MIKIILICFTIIICTALICQMIENISFWDATQGDDFLQKKMDEEDE